jgi:Dolichyl-phosphate-mannose-protein mannosyltransferase
MLARSVTVLPIVFFAALFLRLGGGGVTWLPSAIVLMGLGLAALALNAAVTQRSSFWTGITHDWRGLIARYGFVAGLIALAVLAVLIRLPSIGADLGHQPLDIDEHRLAANVKQFFVKGEIGYHTVEHYPGLFFWMLTGTSLLIYLQGLMEGTLHSIREMPVESFVLAGRLTNTLVASATVVVTGLIGRQMSGTAAGLMAAGILAIAPLSVETMTAMRNDPAQALFVCAAIHAALAASSTDRRAWPVLAGLFSGIATAIKYTGVFALLPALVAALLRGSVSARAARVGLVLLGFVPAIATTNHFLWWDFPNFLRQLSDQVAITGPGHWAALENPAAFHIEILVRFGVGWALLILAAGYGVYGLATGRRDAWVFWLFPLFYSWFTTKRPSQFPRWVFPLLPFVAVAGAAALAWIVSSVRVSPAWTRRRSGPALGATALALLVVAVMGQPLWVGLITLSRRLTPPTQQLVEQWLRERPAGERVLVGQYWLDLTSSRLTVRRVPDLGAALQGGLYSLASNDWVVVPEPFFQNPGLKRLMFVRRVSADQRSLGGNIGYDFEIYASPKLPPSTGRLEIRLGEAEAEPFLGPEWDAPAIGQPGRQLPPKGASLYLPPRSGAVARISVDVAGTNLPAGNSPIAITDAAGPILLGDVPASASSGRSSTGVARLAAGGRATELRLTPANPLHRVRVIRLVID